MLNRDLQKKLHKFFDDWELNLRTSFPVPLDSLYALKREMNEMQDAINQEIVVLETFIKDLSR